MVQVVSWLVRPIKEWRSVLLSVGKLEIASMMSLLMEYPSEVSERPVGEAKFEFVTVQRNSCVFTVVQDLSDVFHMLLLSLSNTTTSSTIFLMPCIPTKASSIRLL